MSITLTELLSPRSRQTLEAMLLAVLQQSPIEGQPGVSFPVTDWNPGAFERVDLKMVATGLLDREDTIKMLTASGFLDLAATLVDSDGNPVEGWMEKLAEQWYRRARNGATYTRQVLTLTCTTGPGPYTRAAGEIVAMSPVTGNRYTNEASVTIPDGGTVTAVFKSEGPGLQTPDASGTIIVLVTPGLPGVTVTNAQTVAGIPASYLTGSGALAVSSTTITSNARSVKLTFTASGRVSDSSAKVLVTVYQGTAVVTTGPLPAGDTLSQDDLTITMTDGPAGTTSYNEGDTWIVSVPGTPLLQAGADKETLASLAQRCRDRWAELSATPTANRYMAMVRDCESANHIGISKVATKPSDLVAGLEEIYIAGPSSTATPAQVATVQNWVDLHVGQVDAANVIAATELPIVLGGTVECRRGTIANVQALADQAWAQYIAGMDIGGDKPKGLVKLLKLEKILDTAGAYNASALTINGNASDASLAALQCASVDDTHGLPSTGLTWLEVA